MCTFLCHKMCNECHDMRGTERETKKRRLKQIYNRLYHVKKKIEGQNICKQDKRKEYEK